MAVQSKENQDARRSIIKDRYVDDTISDVEDVEAAKALEKSIREISATKSFHFKPSVISGASNGSLSQMETF